ncbi:MAG: hypothetical protein IJX57_03375 [Clostridia bacterium]|nr:hypothetical protein [Clostridia bacterium]
MDTQHKYDDIINMPRHISVKHKPMAIKDRAAQFLPFAALTGYDDEIKETARLTDEKIYLSEETTSVINKKICILSESVLPEISITYFVPDNKKTGGSYVTESGTVKKIDDYKKVIVMKNGTEISFKDILDIDGEMFDSII